jgi:hypothetical protein
VCRARGGGVTPSHDGNPNAFKGNFDTRICSGGNFFPGGGREIELKEEKVYTHLDEEK